MQSLIREYSRFFNSSLPFCHTAEEYSLHWVSFLHSDMLQHGANSADVLANTGISDASLGKGSGRVSAVQLLRIALNCLKVSPDVGIRVGGHLGLVACGIYGYAMISSPDRQHLIDTVEKYAHFIDPFTRVSYKSSSKESVWQIVPYFSDDPNNPLYKFSIEIKLASSVRFCKDLYGSDFKLKLVRVKYPKPKNALDYLSILGCEVQFGCDRNEMIYPNIALTPTARFNPDHITHKLILDLCENEAQRIRRRITLSSEIARLVQIHLDKQLGIEDAANMLLMNARTLRRRLKDEGTTFSEIVSEQRMSKAIAYLKNNVMTIEEIAAKLGYYDSSSFRKAFAAWSGEKLSDFRHLYAS
ncbi:MULTISPECIES: AraC family transcriptional regulator [Duganella]|uniref:Helix-turn-helix domain-containing protein n=2 Tax=Duganella TaxID=75654 RepID=A0A845GUC2_9BURK|nr:MULTISPECIES: AraC family transcriptional regulator [Duganella]MYM80757.1 helix-turn-helix domain-containing protein [Duganella lactea]MYM96139.1 helix-turn-helix domain-containing protein [Duganella vulcania]